MLRRWMLVISMIVGASAYLIYHSIPVLHVAGPVLEKICKIIQPTLLFIMLFLSFCRISPSEMKPRRWHLWLLLIQGGFFLLSAGLLYAASHCDNSVGAFLGTLRYPIESIMLCMICPTATACAVVTYKLDGDIAGVVTYTVMINLLVAILVPLVVPVIFPNNGVNFVTAFSRILAKVFPLLIAPALLAWLVRYTSPRALKFLQDRMGWSFYLWAVGLSLAILMSTRGIVKSDQGLVIILWTAVGSLVACIFQFWAGRKIGKHYGYPVTAGQSLGQKNTVFAIWMGYTFMDPVISVAGGFYSIWHNCYNSWQLAHHTKQQTQ